MEDEQEDINNLQPSENDSKDFDAAFDAIVPKEDDNGQSAKTPPVETAPKTEAPQNPRAPKEGLKPPVGGTNAPITTQTPAATSPTALPKDEVIDAIAAPKNISPKNLEGWHALKTEAIRRGQYISTIRKELQEAKGKLNQLDPKLQERLTKAEEEASRLRALYTNEKDPEFIEKFDNKIAANENTVLDILKKGGMNEDNLNRIKQIGINAVPDTFWRQHVLPNVSIVEAKQIEQALADNAKLKVDRKATLDKVGENFKQYEEDQRTKNVQSFETYRQEMGTALSRLTEGLPWCRLQEIPANATPEQKALIEEQNAFYKQSEQRFQLALFPANAAARVEVAFAACLSYKLAADLASENARANAAEEKNKELEKKFEAIKSAGVTNKNSNVSHNEPKKSTLEDRLTMKNDDAIEQGLMEVGA